MTADWRATLAEIQASGVLSMRPDLQDAVLDALAEPQPDDGPYADLPAPDDGVDDDLWTTEEDVRVDTINEARKAELRQLAAELAEPQVNPSEATHPAVDESWTDGRLYVCFEDATGLVAGEGGTQGPSDPYPAMVTWEMGSGSMLSDDARQLGLALVRLADNADSLNAAGLLAEGEESRKP